MVSYNPKDTAHLSIQTQTAVATLTNAAKECSLEIISGNDAYEFTSDQFADVGGACALNGNLTLFSESGDGATTQYEVDFVGGVPGVATEVE